MHDEMAEEMINGYLSEGKIRYRIVHFPLDPIALAVGIIASCQDIKGYHIISRHFLRNQSRWMYASNHLGALQSIAAEVGVEPVDFENCLKSKHKYDSMQSVIRQAKEAGVSAVPTYFINGVKHVGVNTRKELAAILTPLVGPPKDSKIEHLESNAPNVLDPKCSEGKRKAAFEFCASFVFGAFKNSSVAAGSQRRYQEIVRVCRLSEREVALEGVRSARRVIEYYERGIPLDIDGVISRCRG
jgi:glutaredoxin